MGKKKKTDKRPQKCGPNYTVHFSLVVHSCQTLCDPMDCSMPGLPVHHQLQDPTQTIESVMPSSHLILCHPLLLLPPIPPSISIFSNESVLHIRWPKHWSFSFNISPLNEHSGLISLLSKGLSTVFSNTIVQNHQFFSSAFFTVQLSPPYMTTGKTIALTRQTFVGKVISLRLNMLSWLVITFLPRSKRLLISRLQSPSAVIMEPRKIKSDTVSTVSPSISHEVMGPDAMIFVF